MATGINYVNAGTASVTAGDSTVTFAAASLSMVKSGDLFLQKGASGVIASVDVDAGTAELVSVWGGATASAQPYIVLIIPQASELAESTRRLQTQLSAAVLGSFVDLEPSPGETPVWNEDGSAWDLISADTLAESAAPEATVASASTTDIGGTVAQRVQVTGTTTITSFGTKENKLRLVRFAGTLTLTQDATALILLGGANRATSAGDIGIYASDTSGNWRELAYAQANGGTIEAPESTVASASTADIGAAASQRVQITGTTTITGFGTRKNAVRIVRFAGALTLTHDATSLILPGGANITTAANDTAIFASDNAGHWRCHVYERAHGGAAAFTGVTGSGNDVGSNGPTLSGTVALASGAGFSFNGGSLLGDYKQGTYTPSDQSGAGLSFTGVSGGYIVVGKLVFFKLRVTYPGGSLGSASSALSLPFAVQNVDNSDYSPVTLTCNVGSAITGVLVRNAAQVQCVLAAGNSNVTNATMAGATVQIAGCFIKA